MVHLSMSGIATYASPVRIWLTQTLSRQAMLAWGVVGFGLFFVVYQKVVLLQWDFAVYYTAAKALAEGGAPYDPSHLLSVAKEEGGNPYGGLPFLYMPLFARLLYPLTWLSFLDAAWVWFCLKCLALEFILAATVFLIPLPRTLWSWGLLHGAALGFAPFSHDLTTGNIAIFEFAFLMGFFWAWRSGYAWLAGAALLVFSIPKGFPLLWGVYPYALRQKRLLGWIGGWIGVGVGLACLDWHSTSQWWAFYRGPEWAMLWDDMVQGYFNCSSTSVILRIFTETYLTHPLLPFPAVTPVLIPLIPVSILALMAWAVQKESQREGFYPTQASVIALLLPGFLLLPPRLAGYSLSVVYFTLIYCVVSAWRGKRWGVFALIGLGMGLIQIHLPPDHLPLGWPQLLIDKDFWGLLILFFTAWILSRAPQKSKSAP